MTIPAAIAAAQQTIAFTSNGGASWSWNFGDGTTSTAQNPTHIYSKVGTFTVTLTTTYAGGRQQTQSQAITITDAVAAWGYTTAGLQVTFVDFSVSNKTTVTSWLWTFGDGGSSASQNPTHTYAAGGTYTVRLTIGNANGGSSTVSLPVTVSAITRDATSLVYMPASAAEWTAFLSLFSSTLGNWSVPDALGVLNVASGNVADLIGSFNLTASGTGLSYQQAVSGWSSVGIGFTDGDTGVLANTSASLPNLNAESALGLLFADITTIGGGRVISTLGVGTSLKVSARCDTTPRLTALSAGNSANGTANLLGSVRPYVVQSDFTNGVSRVASDQEILTPTRGTPAGQEIAIGSTNTDTPTMVALYAPWWYGAKAERSTADIRALMTALGFSPAW